MASGKKSGLGKIAADAADYSGDLLEPIAMLAGGASKASVAWAAFRNVWMTKVLGPVGMLSGAAAGATVGILKLNKALSEMGMRGAANLENLTQQFKPLLKGIESAKQRIADLSRFAASTPFRLNEVAEANRTLETLTKGALSTQQGMKLVGDAASLTGESFGDMATQVGRLYDGLQSGRPVGMVAQRLQELGILSGAARNQIEELQASGKAGNEVWSVAEKEIQRASGAMDAMSKTLDGLQSNLDDNKTAFQTAFSNSYIEGEKTGVEAMGKAFEKLTPLAKWAGEQLSGVSNIWAKFKASLLVDVAVPVLSKMGKLLAGSAVIAPLSVLMVTLAKVSKSVMGLGAAAGSSQAAADGFKTMASSGRGLWEALKFLVGGQKDLAKGALDGAGATIKQGAAAVKGAGAMGALGGAVRAAATGVKFLAAEMLKATAAALLNPWVLLTAAILAGVMMWKNYSDAQKAAAAEIQRINDVMKEQSALMEEQRSNIKTVTDLTAHYASVVNQLTEAQIALLAAERELANNPTSDNLRQKRDATAANVEAKKKEVGATAKIKEDSLELGPNDDHTTDKLARAKAAREAAYQASLETATPEKRAQLIAAHAKEVADRAAKQDQEDAATRNGQLDDSKRSNDRDNIAKVLAQKKTQLAEQMANMPSKLSMTPGGEGGYEMAANPALATAQQFVSDLQAQIADAEKQLAEIESKTPKTPAMTKAEAQSARETKEFNKAEGQQARNDAASEGIAAQRAGMEEQDRLQQALLDGRAAEIAFMDDGIAKTRALLDLEDQRTEAAGNRNLNPASSEDTANAKRATAAARAHAEAEEALRLAEQEITIKETLTGLDDDTLDTQLKLLELARERLALQKGLSEEARAGAGKEIDAQEQVVRQQYAKRQAAADLDSKDAKNSGKYRGAERAMKENETDRARILNEKDSPERQSRLARNDADKAELQRASDRAAKKAMLETNVADSANRENKLEFGGHKDAAMRERKRRQKDERELKRMSVEDETENIADPKKRARVQKEQMDAFDEAAKQDVSSSKKRKEMVQQAQDAYEAYMRREIQRIKVYMRISEAQSRAASDQDQFLLDHAKSFKGLGIFVDEMSTFTHKQRQDEAAAAKEDKIKLSELFEQYVGDGYDSGSAARMAKDQVNADKAQRATDQRQEKIDFLMGQLGEATSGAGRLATATSSMRAIGGGGGAYGPGKSGDQTAEIARLVAQIKDLLAEPVPFLQPQPGEKPLG